MKFKVVNREGRAVMSTEYIECIPDEEQLKSMAKVGYKFKIDEKTVSVKKIKELIQEK